MDKDDLVSLREIIRTAGENIIAGFAEGVKMISEQISKFGIALYLISKHPGEDIEDVLARMGRKERAKKRYLRRYARNGQRR